MGRRSQVRTEWHKKDSSITICSSDVCSQIKNFIGQEKRKLRMIYVSSDENEAAFQRCFSQMTSWLAVPYSHRKTRVSICSTRYGRMLKVLWSIRSSRIFRGYGTFDLENQIRILICNRYIFCLAGGTSTRVSPIQVAESLVCLWTITQSPFAKQLIKEGCPSPLINFQG